MVGDMFAASNPSHYFGEITRMIRRYEDGNWLPDHFVCSVAVKLFGSPVPDSDNSLAICADDGIFRGLDSGSKMTKPILWSRTQGWLLTTTAVYLFVEYMTTQG